MGRGLAAPAPGEADAQEPHSTITLSHSWPDRGRGGSEGPREPGKSKGEVKTREKKDAVAASACKGHKAVPPQPRFAS